MANPHSRMNLETRKRLTDTNQSQAVTGICPIIRAGLFLDCRRMAWFEQGRSKPSFSRFFPPFRESRFTLIAPLGKFVTAEHLIGNERSVPVPRTKPRGNLLRAGCKKQPPDHDK